MNMTRKEAEVERIRKLKDGLSAPTVNWYGCFGDESALGCDFCEWHGACMELKWSFGVRRGDLVGMAVIVEEVG